MTMNTRTMDENVVEQEPEMEGRDYFILFKERERIEPNVPYYYEDPAPVGNENEKLSWSVTSYKNKVWNELYGGGRVKVSWWGDTGWRVELPGIHLVSRRDFETICKELGSNPLAHYVIKILARERKMVTVRSFLAVNRGLSQFSTGGRGVLWLKVEFAVEEGLIRLRSGRKVAWLPAGHAAETFLAFGQELPNLAQARIMAKASLENKPESFSREL